MLANTKSNNELTSNTNWSGILVTMFLLYTIIMYLTKYPSRVILHTTVPYTGQKWYIEIHCSHANIKSQEKNRCTVLWQPLG